MTNSMTAFARREAETAWGGLVWEIRSVNHRYLEIGLRLPEELRALEPTVREQLAGRLARGKVDAVLHLRPGVAAETPLVLDEMQVRRLAEAARRVAALCSELAPLTVSDVLHWPGVIQAAPLDLAGLSAAALELLSATLDELVAMRAREGARLAAFVLERLASLERIVPQVSAALPEVAERYRARLRERLGGLKHELDAARLEQEILLFAQRTDVTEEVERLAAHAAEVRRVLEGGGAVGRRLDFLMQELNREANTLAAKSVDLRVTNAAVELKVLIEQMREQVQNIE